MHITQNNSFIRSQIYIYSVLPALVAFINFDTEARAITASWDRYFSIKIRGFPAVAIKIYHGNATFHVNFIGKAHINLWFITNTHLCAFFDGNNFTPPVLLRGWLYV